MWDWLDFSEMFFICLDTFLCAVTVCLSVDFETSPALTKTVQGSLAGIRVCEHTAAKRSHRPAYHHHDNPLTAHQVMMTGNARLPLAWHLHYLLVSSTVLPRPLFPSQLTYSISLSLADLASLSIYFCLNFCLFSLFVFFGLMLSHLLHFTAT